MKDNTITTAQAAKRLGVSAQTVQKWVDAGHLPAWKTIGGHRRLDATAVERMVVERATARPLSLMLIADDRCVEALTAKLREIRPSAQLRVYTDPVAALIEAGRDAPDVLIAGPLPGIAQVAAGLRSHHATQHTRVILVGDCDDAALPEGVPRLASPVSPQALDAALAA